MAETIEQLSELRNGFEPGHRYHAILIYAMALKTLGFDSQITLQRAKRIFATMKLQPTFTFGECRQAVFAARTCRGREFSLGMTHKTVIDRLSITQSEQDVLGFRDPISSRPPAKHQVVALRRAQVARLVATQPNISSREVAKQLSVSHDTAWRDMRSIKEQEKAEQ